MARFNVGNADNYGNYDGDSKYAPYFSLKNDKDTARVRFLYGSVDDVEGYAVHKVSVGTRKDGRPNERWVNCLREYNDPVDKCPFCAAQFKVTPRLFLKLYNEDTKQCELWERSKSYFQRISSLSSRYNPLYNKVIEVERNGAAGDMHTDYVFYPLDDCEKIDIEDEKYEFPEILGSTVLDKTEDEMHVYLDTGAFPSDSVEVSSTRSESYGRRSEQPVRRTPSSEAPTRRAF